MTVFKPIWSVFLFNILVTFIVTILLLLQGCASVPRTVEISCFTSDEATKTKTAKEAIVPVIIEKGTVLYYDDNGLLNRVREGTCGLK